MSASETESEPESEPSLGTIPSLVAFASLSATRQSHGPADQGTVSWAVDTLATLDFCLVRKDTALHGLIQSCASTILALLNTVLQLGPDTDTSCSFISDVTNIFRPSFSHLLFQYRRLFHVIAARDFKRDSAPLTVVCWVDVVLAKLGDVAAFIATGLDGNHPDLLLPESLKARRDEDSLRAAIQLPDNWDMLPSMLLSECVSPATKRLSIRLMLGRFILFPALSGQVGMSNNIHAFRSTFAEFIRQNAVRIDELRLVLGRGPQYLMQQERLTSAMAISLFAAADMGQYSAINPGNEATFRPQTVAAAMQLLRFVLNERGHFSHQSNILNPPDRLNIATNVIIRWGVVPQWAWNVWSEYHSLHADTIIFLTMAYIQHYRTGPGELSGAVDLISADSGSSNQAAAISVIIILISRFVSILSARGQVEQFSTDTMNVVHGTCQLISQWMNRNSCGIRASAECCKMLLGLFGHLSLDDRHFAVNDLVIESLVHINERCIREAWGAVVDDKKIGLLEALDQRLKRIKTVQSWDDLPRSRDVYMVQLMQFLTVMMSRGIRPVGLEALVEFTGTVKERILEMPMNDRGFLCETLLACLATANLSGVDLSLNGTIDDEAMWHLGMCSGDKNLFLTSAFSLYITSAPVSVEALTRLECLEHLADTALLIISGHYLGEDEPLALIILPTVCDALGHLLGHGDDTTGEHTWENMRMSALGSVVQSLSSRKGPVHDGYSALLKRRLLSTAIGASLEGGERGTGPMRREYELAFCRLDGFSHMLYVTVA